MSYYIDRVIIFLLLINIGVLGGPETCKNRGSESDQSCDDVKDKPTSNEDKDLVLKIKLIDTDNPKDRRDPSNFEKKVINITLLDRKDNAEEVNKYPYTVSIQKRRVHYATGVLLHKLWVMSVAAQFYNVRESIKLFRVNLGSSDNKKGYSVPLKLIAIHPAFVKGRPHYDLTLMKLAHPVVYTNNVKPIVIKHIARCSIVEVATPYWPRLAIPDSCLPPDEGVDQCESHILVTTLKTIQWKRCQKIMRSMNNTLNKATSCLRIEPGKQNCLPDAGAPVVVNNFLHGIISSWTSRNNGENICNREQSPVLFTTLGTSCITKWIFHTLLHN